MATIEREEQRKAETIREMIAQSAEGKFQFAAVVAN
jgi:hypothetical protein